MTVPDPDHEQLPTGRQLQVDLANARELAAQHGAPETISAADALTWAVIEGIPVPPAVTADDIRASIYRNDTAADAWLDSNRVNGHPTLAMVPLPDGRVVGILDLRPALERARGQS